MESKFRKVGILPLLLGFAFITFIGSELQHLLQNSFSISPSSARVVSVIFVVFTFLIWAVYTRRFIHPDEDSTELDVPKPNV